jgi:putative two-component system response regulator
MFNRDETGSLFLLGTPMEHTTIQPAERSKLLIVDDDDQVRAVISVIVESEGYSFRSAINAEAALQLLEQESFDLVISDINMTGMTGVELLDTCRKIYQDLAFIMVTGVDDRTTAIETLHMGAYGYVTKPFQANELIINITNALRRRRLEIENRRHREELELLVDERTFELDKSREETILILSKTAEFRDNETAKHTVRMGKFCETLARLMGLPESLCKTLKISAPLHDVGKIGISDTILLKPGKLSIEEFEVIKTHCEIGHRILSESTSSILQVGAEIALTHHEKFDGSGYPRGLKGEEIPIIGRIAAICDVFDALTSERVYKSASSVDEALEIIRQSSGNHFDPDITALFIGNIDRILSIRAGLAD